MFLTMYYVPDIVNAWKSVYYLQHDVAAGVIVRGMHHWGASLVVVMMFYIHFVYSLQDLINNLEN